MKRVIRSSTSFTEDQILDLLDIAQHALIKECELRGQDEYVDDVRWGKDRFEIPIFVSPSPTSTDEVARFTFVYDPEDEDYPSIEDQMHVKLDEFIEDWNTDDSEYDGDDYIEDAIDDAVFTVLEKYRKTKSVDEMMVLIQKKLTSKPYNLTEGEDFTTDDISEAINDYKYYWSD